MNRIIFVLLISGPVFSSCGTGKKLEAANQQIQGLNQQVAGLNKQVADDKSTIDQLKMANKECGQESADCKKTKADIALKYYDLKSRLDERGQSMKQIRAKADAALDMFREAGAEVTFKNGLVYVSMQDLLLFPAGSTKVSDQGRQALSVVADVLAEYPHVSAIVVGNTDSVAIRKTYKDNWSLSTERANTIVRILRDNYMADPSRITAAGKGKYAPVADNATPEGRAKNRRTDIIFSPDLSKLWDIPE